jgi:6-phosphofructokinase 1
VPKTIDNDYGGIDFTFGFFTAVDELARQLRNLRADALATGSYFIVSTMGRRAGWLAYGVAVAGEAHMVVGVEDVEDPSGGLAKGSHLDVDALVDRIVDLIETRQKRGKRYGTVVLAEGLSEMLPQEEVQGVPRDDYGHISFSQLDLAKRIAAQVRAQYARRFGEAKKVTGVQLGYESRCSAPHAFDVMLGSQLGLGAYRALVEEGLDACMVSVQGQLELHYVPFSQLIDPQSLRTETRLIRPGSDFHRLATELGTRIRRA